MGYKKYRVAQSLPLKYNFVVFAIEETKDLSEVWLSANEILKAHRKHIQKQAIQVRKKYFSLSKVLKLQVLKGLNIEVLNGTKGHQLVGMR